MHSSVANPERLEAITRRRSEPRTSVRADLQLRTRRRALDTLFLIVALSVSIAPAIADEIITPDRSIQRIQIVGFSAGDLVYRDENGLESSFPVADPTRRNHWNEHRRPKSCRSDSGRETFFSR